ncbi:hypothetical protein FA95DRAFT_1552524 [Auriscalpium vulgare]|uniref:Uncharacterized protein n=1 Tax=Auriscalpium vulgare TaxID=40419 RepID=A0ACB8SA47_9AGAM|nr:hypothetical protein FA95DRAFT_1552524 [Auriscalpium vulgare]
MTDTNHSNLTLAPRLPPELWFLIFRHATDALWSTSHVYRPFQARFASGDVCDAALHVKHAIVRVCKQWRALGADVFYEDIRAGPGLPALIQTLDQQHPENIPRRWVRRVVLPYTHSDTPTWRPTPAVQLMELCADIDVLVRPPLPSGHPYVLRFDFPTTTPTFARLRRIDWWQHNDAARTDGINALDDVLRHAPHVEHLVLGGDFHLTALRQQRLVLPRLHTVHMRRVNALGVRQLCMWTLPALAHLVVETPLPPQEACEAVWEKYGPQLQVVELGAAGDQLAAVLAACPAVVELNYHARATCLPRGVGHDTLQRVGLFVEEREDMWRDVEEHLSGYPKDDFPALTQFVLYGRDWACILANPRFREMEESLKMVGRSIVLEA